MRDLGCWGRWKAASECSPIDRVFAIATTMGEDGKLRFIAQDGDQMKRFVIPADAGRGIAEMASMKSLR